MTTISGCRLMPECKIIRQSSVNLNSMKRRAVVPLCDDDFMLSLPAGGQFALENDGSSPHLNSSLIMSSMAHVFVALALTAMLSGGLAVNITSFSASLRWSFAMGSYVKAMPKLSLDGLTVYSSSGEGCADTANTMFALSVDTGAVHWQVAVAPASYAFAQSNCIRRRVPAGTAASARRPLATAPLILLLLLTVPARCISAICSVATAGTPSLTTRTEP